MKTPIILENNLVKLIPLEFSHWNSLWSVAQQVDIYTYGPSDISTQEKLKNYIQKALNLHEEKKAIPFCIVNKNTDQIVGSTRYGNIDASNKVLHIGWTWISPETQGTGFNHQMKYLLLKYAFETLKFEKVEFRIDERNIKSRKAVEKLGAQLEGILRKTTYTKNNIKRNSCCYGILAEEWENLKETIFNSYSSTTGTGTGAS